MDQTRKYNSGETPRIGDVIRLFNGSFGDGVIVSVKVGRFNEPEEYLLYRPHVSFKQGVPVPETEIVWIREASLREYPVYVTGASGKIENRNY